MAQWEAGEGPNRMVALEAENRQLRDALELSTQLVRFSLTTSLDSFGVRPHAGFERRDAEIQSHGMKCMLT